MSINIFGVNISKKKKIFFGLIKIYGIGLKSSKKICEEIKINKKLNFYEINFITLNLLKEKISKLKIENDLRILEKERIKRILFLNNYKSFRHKKKLPCRGQRTKTNSKTRKKMNHEKV